ncbi:MAG TPA: hypothetical protein VGR02_13420 [Thermoanaerobaculia bacterium]|jgi:photosystem II stability/assembly factor-like uncharacterized protein|nr:hypothetical protein [Thermoanaerobaculia bacterium]
MRPFPIACLLLLALSCSHAESEREREAFDDPQEAAEYYAMKRRAPEGVSPHALYEAARVKMAAMPRHDTVPRNDQAKAVGGWTFLGPGNIGGRTRVLVIDPVENEVMWTGGVSGGIWKTYDGGGHWQPVGDQLANLAVNSLVQDPKDRNTLFAGTGEGYFREDVRGTDLPLRGNGIYATHDGGTTWSILPSTDDRDDFRWVNDLAVSAHDSQRLYAATRTGVWRSTDAGITWTRVVTTNVKGGCLDLALRGDQEGDYLFASCGIFEQATVYRSKNAQTDAAWEAVLRDPGMSRTTLAIAPSRTSTIYALSAENSSSPDRDQQLHAVFRSDANGDADSWQKLASSADADRVNRTLLTNPISVYQAICNGGQNFAAGVAMGWHCNVIAVDPTNPDRVWAAGVDLFRSDDGGRNWGVASYWWTDDTKPSFVHADQHVIAFHPRYDGSANQTMFATNDGGVYRTENANAAVGRGTSGVCQDTASQVAWTSLNHSYGVTQFYQGAVFPNGRSFLGGAQDNGTLVGTIADGPDRWTRPWGGDGAYVAIDPVDPQKVVTESQFGNLAVSIDGGRSFRSVQPPVDDFLFITPFVIDPNDHQRIWIGGRHMSRSNEATGGWSVASTQLPNEAGQISALAVAPGRPDRMLAGTNEGVLLRTDQATTATPSTEWTRVSPRGGGYVSSIAFDPFNSDLVYATYAGFGGGPHVWKSTDGGANWSPLDAGLPDIPMHSLAIDPTQTTRLYLGTDLGIFVSTDGGTTWEVENTGFAAVVTECVVIGQGVRGPAVYAFTHGRGAWRAELTTGTRRRPR